MIPLISQFPDSTKHLGNPQRKCLSVINWRNEIIIKSSADLG